MPLPRPNLVLPIRSLSPPWNWMAFLFLPGRKAAHALTAFLSFSSLLAISLFLLLTVTPLRYSSDPAPGRLLRFAVPRLRSEQDGCSGLSNLHGSDSKCSDLRARPCVPRGYIDYLHIFYCACGGRPLLGYALLFLWLLLLFYLLGSTASRYFCASLESLSRLLRLPPAIAGVTLLSLGNGAPDVFSSVVSLAGSGGRAGDVGVSSVLGGAFFVSSVVVGVISIALGPRAVAVDRRSFVRDVCFLLLALCALFVVLIVGRISLWGALAFSSVYIVYVIIVVTWHCFEDKHSELMAPLLDGLGAEEDPDLLVKGHQSRPMSCSWVWVYFKWLLYLLELPLHLPRRLTIPDVSEERWSKPFAVASVTLSPLLLAALWVSQREEMGSDEMWTVCLLGGSLGLGFGVAATQTTETASPPTKCLLPWLAGGFLMSMVWAYVTARELVALLVSLGYILGISPLILGLTVLAWGNSLGDLMANVAMALRGGGDGLRIAVSGCYAGPIFNTLVGLGLALVLASAAEHPRPFLIPQDASLFETLAFLVGALLWALVILPRRGMKPDRVLGVGLLAIYLTFLCLRLCESLGLVNPGRAFPL